MSADDSLTYEQALARLDDVLRALEDGKLTLEDAIAAVASGREYLRVCQEKLNEARRRIETLPVLEEPRNEDDPPHPASVAELRGEGKAPTPRPSQDEIPF